MKIEINKNLCDIKIYYSHFLILTARQSVNTDPMER